MSTKWSALTDVRSARYWPRIMACPSVWGDDLDWDRGLEFILLQHKVAWWDRPLVMSLTHRGRVERGHGPTPYALVRAVQVALSCRRRREVTLRGVVAVWRHITRVRLGQRGLPYVRVVISGAAIVDRDAEVLTDEPLIVRIPLAVLGIEADSLIDGLLTFGARSWLPLRDSFTLSSVLPFPTMRTSRAMFSVGAASGRFMLVREGDINQEGGNLGRILSIKVWWLWGNERWAREGYVCECL